VLLEDGCYLPGFLKSFHRKKECRRASPDLRKSTNQLKELACHDYWSALEWWFCDEDGKDSISRTAGVSLLGGQSMSFDICNGPESGSRKFQ
jgi:hypothetical protein